MRVGHDIYLEQQQKLLITPELRQAIAILQMSAMELEEYLQQLMADNPILEEKEATREETENLNPPNATEEPTTPRLEEWRDFLHDRESGQVYADNEEQRGEHYPDHLPSLYEHLNFQLQMLSQDVLGSEIGTYLVGNIDASGYLVIKVEEAAAQLGVRVEQVEQVLELIQTFHPHGTGARDLAECLMIQLSYYGRDDAVSVALVQNHLEDIARGRMQQLAQRYGLNVKEIQERCDFIRTLDPRPGLQYSSEAIKYIVPDIMVEKIEGEYIVILNENYTSGLMVNRMYEQMLRDPSSIGRELRHYLEEKMNSALWVMKSIEQRRQTLYKVACYIVEWQHGFLEHGVQHLRPLTLKQVADQVEMHESTISRVTTNKYMQTPRGVFELKYFFSGGIESVDGVADILSSRSVKDRLRKMIEDETSSAPLSDQAIVDRLNAEGINLSRRTVTKYRQEMDIPAAAARRRY